jgi:hypothetical protein
MAFVILFLAVIGIGAKIYDRLLRNSGMKKGEVIGITAALVFPLAAMVMLAAIFRH